MGRPRPFPCKGTGDLPFKGVPVVRDAVCLLPSSRADAMLASAPTRAMAGLPVLTMSCVVFFCSAAIFSPRVSSLSSSSRQALMSHQVAYGNFLEDLNLTTLAPGNLPYEPLS